MEGSGWESTFTHFQAHIRGYLVRKDISSVRSEFEDIVRDLDGQADHLNWREGIIATPHFTDTDGPLRIQRNSVRKHAAVGPDVGARPAGSSGHALSSRMEPERDESPSQELSLCRRSSRPPEGSGEPESNPAEQGESRAAVSTADAPTVCGRTGPDGSYGHLQQGLLRCCSAQDVPRTPDALRLHRNTIAMELLWLQQAITSRKKYLSLKQRLNVS